jgi:sugar lactone lactonase YvrE
VITADGGTMIVGESFGHRFQAFPRQPDGSLGPGRRWADLGDRSPDGCTLDAEGAIWFAHPTGREVVRVFEGGRITDVRELPDKAYACALGGPDGRTLFVLTSPYIPASDSQPGGARIWATEVDAGHAGWP